MFTYSVVCADIGSVEKNRFDWWSSEGAEGVRPSGLAQHVADLLNAGNAVALGFECPLFVPLAEDEVQLTARRPCEDRHPWSAGAGCAVLAAGLAQVTWMLDKIRSRSGERRVEAHLRWSEFATRQSGPLLWEAFVCGDAHGQSHVEDARAGGQAFRAAVEVSSAGPQSAVVCDGEVHSLIGAALLRTGWSVDLALLGRQCLVVRAVVRA